MNCKICGEENKNDDIRCSKCGTLLVDSNEYLKNKKLFGFRSNKLIKKILASIYYFFDFWLTLLFTITININNLANIVLVIFSILFINSPWLIFSNYEFSKKIRELPLLRKNKIWSNIIFYIVWFFISMILIGIIGSIFG